MVNVHVAVCARTNGCKLATSREKRSVVVTSLVAQQLGLWAPTAGDGFDPGRETKILHARWCIQKKKKNQVAAY